MKSKNSRVLKNYKQLSVVTLLAFGSCLLLISGFGIASVAYGAFPSGEITNAENVVKADISHEKAVVKADISHEQAVVNAAEERFPTPALP
jgi:hypothetical protein